MGRALKGSLAHKSGQTLSYLHRGNIDEEKKFLQHPTPGWLSSITFLWSSRIFFDWNIGKRKL